MHGVEERLLLEELQDQSDDTAKQWEKISTETQAQKYDCSDYYKITFEGVKGNEEADKSYSPESALTLIFDAAGKRKEFFACNLFTHSNRAFSSFPKQAMNTFVWLCFVAASSV